MTCRVPSLRNDAVTHANKTPPPPHDPSRQALCLRVRRRGVYRACTSAHSHKKNLLFFASSRARQYTTVTATSRCGSSARFDGDIGHVIIDASLVHRRIAMCGRGCRRQRIDIQQNKSTCGCNALASTDPPNEPITPAIVRGHLLLDGQHPKQVHCS